MNIANPPSSPAVAPARRGRGALLTVFLTIFIDMLGVGILIPVTPFIVRQFSTDAIAVGLLSVSYSVFQFFAAPVLGQLSDRFGRRPVLLISLFGTAIGYYIFGIGGALWVLLLSRVIDGITGGNISIAQAYIADITPPQDRSKNFGLIGAAFGLGFILGPALGGLLSTISLSAPAYFAGTLALLNTAVGFVTLPESLPKSQRVAKPLTLANANPVRGLVEGLKRPNLSALLLAIFAFNFAFAGLQSNFSIYTLDRFGWGPGQSAVLFSVIGVIGAVMQGGVVRRLVPRFGDRKLAIVGLALMSAAFVGVAFAPDAWMLFVTGALMAIGSGLATPTTTGMVSNSVPQHEQGMILGVTQGFGALTRVFGPLWAGLTYDVIGQGAPYWTGAIAIAAAIALVASFRASARDEQKAAQPSVVAGHGFEPAVRPMTSGK